METLELLVESGLCVEFSKVNIVESVYSMLESKGDVIVTLPVCRLDTPTANGRTYTSSMMSKAIEEAKPAIEGRRLLCSGDDHPASTHVAPINSSHLVIDAWVKDGFLWNKWKILETSNGKNLKALIKGGAAIGTSIRGRGRVTPSKTIENYDYLGTDAVGNPAAGTYALTGCDGVTVEVLESKDSSKSEYQSKGSITESGITIPGVGEVNQNSHISFRGGNYRVSNISGSSEQYQMTLYSLDPTNNNSIFVMSSDIKDASKEISIIKEDSKELMSIDKLTKLMDKIREASEKLQAIRESGVASDEMKFIATFENSLSQDTSLTGSELKKLQEAWDKEKNKKTTKLEETKVAEKLQVETQLESLNTKFSELSKLVESTLALVSSKEEKDTVSEEEQKMISVMKAAPYSFDGAVISEVLQAYLAHPDYEKGFADELTSRLGDKSKDINFEQLFKDITVASGDRQYAGDTGQTPNYATENKVLTDLLSDFCDKVESGSLVSKEEVLEKINLVVEESRNLTRKYQLREAILTEFLVEQLMTTAPVIRHLKTVSEETSKLWEAAQVIINNLREELIKKDNKVVRESLSESKVVEKVRSPKRVNGWV